MADNIDDDFGDFEAAVEKQALPSIESEPVVVHDPSADTIDDDFGDFEAAVEKQALPSIESEPVVVHDPSADTIDDDFGDFEAAVEKQALPSSEAGNTASNSSIVVDDFDAFGSAPMPQQNLSNLVDSTRSLRVAEDIDNDEFDIALKNPSASLGEKDTTVDFMLENEVDEQNDFGDVNENEEDEDEDDGRTKKDLSFINLSLEGFAQSLMQQPKQQQHEGGISSSPAPAPAKKLSSIGFLKPPPPPPLSAIQVASADSTVAVDTASSNELAGDVASTSPTVSAACRKYRYSSSNNSLSFPVNIQTAYCILHEDDLFLFLLQFVTPSSEQTIAPSSHESISDQTISNILNSCKQIWSESRKQVEAENKLEISKTDSSTFSTSIPLSYFLDFDGFFSSFLAYLLLTTSSSIKDFSVSRSELSLSCLKVLRDSALAVLKKMKHELLPYISYQKLKSFVEENKYPVSEDEFKLISLYPLALEYYQSLSLSDSSPSQNSKQILFHLTSVVSKLNGPSVTILPSKDTSIHPSRMSSLISPPSWLEYKVHPMWESTQSDQARIQTVDPWVFTAIQGNSSVISKKVQAKQQDLLKKSPVRTSTMHQEDISISNSISLQSFVAVQPMNNDETNKNEPVQPSELTLSEIKELAKTLVTAFEQKIIHL
jgi:hypothetical protein